MAGLLAYGAGASDGLDKYVERLMAEHELGIRQKQQEESVRHNRSTEDYNAENMRLQNQLRSDAQQDRLDIAGQASKDRQSNIALKAAEMQPIDSLVTEKDAGAQMAAGVPRANYEWEPGNMGMTVAPTKENPMGEEVGPRLTGFRWRGSQKDLSAADRLELDSRRAAGTKEYQNRRATTAEAAEDRQERWGPPVVTVGDPNTPGGTRIQPRGTIPSQGVTGPAPAGERTKIDNYKNTLNTIARIKRLGKETNWKGVGPIAGRLGSAGMELLGQGDPKDEELRNALSQLNADASVDRGGKTFTETEKKMLAEFLANYKQNPTAAVTRLDQFGTSAQQYLRQMGVELDPESDEEQNGPGGLPKIGGTFQGGKVLKVTPVK